MLEYTNQTCQERRTLVKKHTVKNRKVKPDNKRMNKVNKGFPKKNSG